MKACQMVIQCCGIAYANKINRSRKFNQHNDKMVYTNKYMQSFILNFTVLSTKKFQQHLSILMRSFLGCYDWIYGQTDISFRLQDHFDWLELAGGGSICGNEHPRPEQNAKSGA
jgi:hypothetical protein